MCKALHRVLLCYRVTEYNIVESRGGTSGVGWVHNFLLDGVGVWGILDKIRP